MNAENIDTIYLFSYIVIFEENIWKILNWNKIYENCLLKKTSQKPYIKYNFTK